MIQCLTALSGVSTRDYKQFMSKEYAKQNPKEDTNEHSGNIDGLGFNGEDHESYY